jgi:ribonucleoside-triphosphate reductase
LALLDKQKYNDIVTGSRKVPRYTNSTQLPVEFTDDVFRALDHQQPLQELYTGGTVFHAFFGERMPDAEASKSFVKRVFTKYRIPYLTLTPTYSICPSHGYMSGIVEKCPKCQKTCEVYSRVVGYYRPVSNWNAGKQEEFRQRKTYAMKSKW